MPRMSFLIGSGVYLFGAAASSAQLLPPNPARPQATVYRQWQEQTGRKQQLLLNTGLYPVGQKNFNRQKQIMVTSPVSPVIISLREYIPLNLSGTLKNNYAGVVIERQPVRWRDANWWSDPARGQGAAILREILINNRR